MSFSYLPFDHIDLSDAFFDSLKADYAEFPNWFAKKAKECAYVSRNDAGHIDGFLYLKREDEAHPEIVPPMPAKPRLKVGTFKIEAHGTRLGDRFVKKIFDRAVAESVSEIYVTVFEKHAGLLKLLQRYGFDEIGKKVGANGSELVLGRSLIWQDVDIHKNYPLVAINKGKKVLLAVYPIYHTQLLPDSMLITEGPNIVKDITHTNSIQKIYLAGLSGAENLKRGDALIIYRTSDNKGPAYYRSVATSACIVESVRRIHEFGTEAAFLAYCLPFSVFTEVELKNFYKTKKYPVLITFTYNVSFPKRVTRKDLLEKVGLSDQERWTCMEITDKQFKAILLEAQVSANLIVDQA